MKQAVFVGAATALITPMLADGGIDLTGLRRLVDQQIRSGIDALVVCGTTGEAATLDAKEHLQVLAAAIEEADGRVPIIAGTGSNDTACAMRTSKAAARLGADAQLVITPYCNKTTQEGLIRHFTAVAESAGLPTVLYNVPARSGMDVSVETCVRLAEHPLIAGIKEASGDMVKAARIAALCGDRLPVYCGNDDLALPVLAAGGKGVISVISNLIPGEMSRLCQTAFVGDFPACRRIYQRFLPLMELLFAQVNPIPVKKAMALIGRPAGPCRLPLVECTEQLSRQLRTEMDRLGLKA